VSLGGSDPNKYYHHNPNKGEVVDLVLTGLKETCDKQDIKQAAKVKHIIMNEVDVDNFKGICKGTGRVQIRLNDGESAA
jgi:hypothetical protein